MSKILFLGAGGTGMRGLMYLFQEKENEVAAFDDNPDFDGLSLVDALSSLATTSLVVYTDAALHTHPLRQAAHEHNIRQLPYHGALGEFSRDYTTIAVTGTHGKSSTTAFLAHMCMEAGLDPTVLIGAKMPGLPGEHARLGKGKYFIVEADEYRSHFLTLSPAHAIITTVDFDHPDAFSSLADVEDAYSKFLDLLDSSGVLAVPEMEFQNHPAIAWPKNTILVQSEDIPSFQPPIPGKHMAMNALLAASIAEQLGIPKQTALASLTTFPGLERRFELLGTIRGCDIRSDYGHHPAEIKATIASARQAYPKKHLTVLFEAHMPLRLRTFFDDFAAALSGADTIVVTAPFAPAGRDESGVEDAKRLADMLTKSGNKALYRENIQEYMTRELESDVLLFFSAGTLDFLMRKIVNQG